MFKDHSHHVIATYALLILASPLIFAGNADAQAVNCPAGYTCTQYRHTQVSNCPAGYVCTPSPTANTSDASSGGYYGSTGSGGYYSTTGSGSYAGATTNTNISATNVCSLKADLVQGNRGADVAALQGFLISKGYDIPNVSSGRIAAGSFGANTVTALKRYQAANGINENGRLGPLTRAKIAAACGTATTPSNAVSDTSITLRGPAIDTFTVTPSRVVEGQSVTFSGTARQGSSCLAYHKAIVVDSQTPTWSVATNRWAELNCTQSVTLSNVVSTAKNPYAFNGPGTYKVRWQVQDKDGRVASEERTVVVTASSAAAAPVINSLTVSVTPPGVDQKPIGYLDNVSCSLIAGWAYDPDNSTAQIGVHVYSGGQAGSGGTFIGSTIANVSRPDVNSAKGITGNHGFNFIVPASLYDGASHAIYAYGININTSTNLNNSLLPNSGLVITGCK